MPSWTLDDASVIARENPYTFYKPSSRAIAQLGSGNLAKLIFVFVSDNPEHPRAERMWVKIERRDGHVFHGILDNDP